ncbi:MAG: helix-turn-helix domain-containing protein [Pseudomonadota bacterium]
MLTDTDWYGPDAATFGDRVAAAREHADMTQAVLAKRLGIRQATLREWEDDLKEPRANRLSMLAGVLNVSMMWLITGEGEGVDAPSDEATSAGDLPQIMAEMRSLRGKMLRNAEAMGRLEKRMRQVLDDQGRV